MKNKNTEDNIMDNLETYSPLLDEINKTEIYKPSFMFSWQDRLAKWVQKHLGETSIDGEEELKSLMITVFSFVGIFSLVVLGIVIF